MVSVVEPFRISIFVLRISLCRAQGLGCSPFARRYLGNLLMIYFPGATWMFRFAPYPTQSYTIRQSLTAFTQGSPSCDGWVAPFGNRRIKGLWHLPDEYRRHMRPSSAKISKASIVGIMSRFKKLIHATNLN